MYRNTTSGTFEKCPEGMSDNRINTMRIHARIERLQPRAEHVELSIDIVAGTERTARYGPKAGL